MATEPPHVYGSIDDELTVDVAVIGGGIAGLTTAYLCQTKGKRVAVVDAAQMASGVTGNTTAKITALQEPIYAKLARDYGANVATAYATASLAALDTIEDIIKEARIECSFERKPAFTYATSVEGAERLADEARAAAEAGLEVHDATGFGLPFSAAAALQLNDQAQFHARRYCLGLADVIASGGGVVTENVRATAVHSGDPCVVETEQGTIRAADIVVATHIPFMYRGLYFAKTRPSRSYVIAAPWDGPSVDGMYLSADAPVRSVREHRENGQTWIIVGGGSAKTAQDDPERQYDELRRWASEHFGITSPEYEWSAQDLVSGDGLPLIGTATPATPHIWIATGFRKWGMTNATTAAEIITTAITGSEHPLAHVFAPRRHPTAMLRRMAGEVIDTAKHFIGDRLAAHRAAGPAPGEGAVFSRDGENVAVYVSDEGERLEVSAVCTHLGCLVAWNGAEKTWDCPCHGSRFAVDGSVIEGPAVEPLGSLDEPERKPA